jgi:hypothetical protein
LPDLQEFTKMSSQAYADFGDLYRAAFSEADPDRKQRLLADVKKILDRWAATVDSPPTFIMRKHPGRHENHESFSKRTVA